MLDSTARAERIDLAAAEAAFYTWEVAQKPVAVRVPLALIDRLESEAVENFRSLTSRGSEIGGLLLGTVTPGAPSIVTLSDFELIVCDYSRGPLYRLSDADQGRFEQAIEKHAGGGGSRAVGYFRSHTRKGLLLDAEDLAFFEPRFLEPQHLILLIRPFATKVSTAGIFIRENGRIAAETSHLEFPFRSSELKSGRGGVEKSEPASSGAPTAAQPALPPKPQARAQIVPIASRREIALPDPVVAATPPPPIAVERVEAPAAPPVKAQASAPPVEKDKEKAAAAPEKPASAPPEKAAAPLAEPFVRGASEAPVEEEAAAVIAAPGKGKNKKLRLMVAAAVGMLALGGSIIVYPMLRRSIAPRPTTAQQDSSALSLRVERTSGGMLLTWNRDLPAIQSASKVVLAISDGDRHENIELDPNQVRTGGFVYSPITGDVSFQMEVTDPHQTKTTSESLRVHDPRPSPLADPATDTAAKTAAVKPSTPAAPAVVSTPANSETTPAPEATSEQTQTPHSNVPLKPFNSQSLAQRLRPANSTELAALPDAPAVSRSTAGATGSLPGLVATPVLPPPPPKTAAPAPAPAVGGQIIPAQVVSKVNPVYPRFAQQSGASGMVELEATITEDGKVKNARVTHGNVMLQKAAIDAVMQWRYKPAMLNGKPVESPVNIKLNFVAH